MATLSNNNNDTVITGTDLADKIYSSGVNVQIYGNEGDDTIENRGYDVTIEAGAGNDSIWTDVLTSYGSDNYRSATVDGGDGDDTIKVRDHQTSLNGGAGSDVISVYSSKWENNTLQGGKGTDIIYGGKTNVFVYEEGDGDDTIYYAKSNDTVQIATNSGYTSTTSGNDLLINVGDGSMTFKNAANLSLNIVTVPYQGNSEELRAASLKALNDFIKIGAGTDYLPSDTASDLAAEVANSSSDVVRMMGKLYGEMTKYELDDHGHPKLDSNGDKIKNTSPNKTKIEAGYKALLNINAILQSTKKIAEENLSGADLLEEELKISTQTNELIANFEKLSGDPTAGLITPLGSAAIGLSTDVINTFAGGLNKDVVSGIISNGAELFTESLKLLGESTVLKDTSFGTWITGKAAGTKVETFVNRIFGQTVETVTNRIGNTVSAFLGVYSAINTCLDSIDKYSIAGLPDSVTAINTAIDVIGDGIHSFSNAFVSVLTVGTADADMIFNGVYAIGALIKYDLQSIWALATGGDVSQITFRTESRNFTEIIGDALKSLITGTTEADEIYIVDNDKEKHALGGNKKVHNFGSRCTITTDSGKDLVFNHEGTQSNYADAGNDNDIVVAHGSNNTLKGGQGSDKIALYSDGKSPAGGNVLDGGTGSDAILIDDSKYPTTTRRSNNTIISGEGDDLIGIDNTNVPVVIRYTVGDGNDYIFGYDSNDTIQIVNSDYSSSKSGQDIKITVGAGVMTLMGANGKTLNIEKVSEGIPTGISYDKNKTTLTVNTKFSGEQINLANFASTVKKVNASALVNAVNITGNALGNSIKGGSGSDTLSGGAGKDTLLGNGGNDTIYGLNGDDSLDGGLGKDVLFGGVGNDNLKGGGGNDLFVYTDGNDTILDYTANVDRISLAGGNSAAYLSHITGVRVNGSDVTLVFSNNNSKTLTLKKAVGKKVSINEDTAVFGRDGTKSIIIHSTFGGKFNGIDYKDVDASACTRAVSILGGALDSSIKGGAGSDTINGGAGSDTLTGGKSSDLFVFSAGNDTITDYTSGTDRISLGSAVKSTAVNGSDAVLTTAKGSLTVKNGKGKSLSMINSAGKSFTTIIGGSTLNVTNSTPSPVTIDSAVKVVDASLRTKAIQITGNTLANTLQGGRGADTLYGGAGSDSILGNAGNDKLFGEAGSDTLVGGAGSDTLTGGKGNDSLWGDAGKDTFLYALGDGRDVIFGFENNDLLQITGTFSASYNSKTNAVAFKVGSTANAITLKDFTATTFHINNDTYAISGGKFLKK